MIKKIFIVISGTYLVILGLLSSFVLVMFFFTFLGKDVSNMPKNFNPYASSIIFLVIIGWLLVTGIGIILRKNWARYSLFIMSSLGLFIGLMSIAAMFFLPIKNSSFTNRIYMVIPSCIFFIVVPVLFLIFFTRKSVIKLFSKATKDTDTHIRPIGITIITALTFIGVIYSSISAIKPNFFMPYIDIFGIVIRNKAILHIYYFVTAIITFYVAWNLFKLRKNGWLSFVFYYIFMIFNGLISILRLDETTASELFALMNKPSLNLSLKTIKTFSIAGFLFPIIILGYVISKKQLFFKGRNA